MKKHKWLLYSGIIAVCFLWTGSAYLSQAYRLLDFYEPSRVDIITQILNYIMQVLGLAAFSLMMKHYPGVTANHRFFTGLILAEAVVIPVVLTVNASVVMVAAGFLMNLLHGVVAGYYLMQLSAFVPKEHRGKAFGFGYAIGSIGTWILSLPSGGKFLQSKSVIIVYLFLMALSVVMMKFTEKIPEKCERDKKGEGERDEKAVPGGRAVQLKLIFLLIVLLTFTKGVGFCFPIADIRDIVSVEFSRAFYALGLIVAGIINDKSRKSGASLALISIIFPFISIALNGNPSFVALMWIMGYIFLGLLVVYRVIVFSDVSAKQINLLPLAGVGLLAGRIGDALGTAAGILCGNNTVLLLAVTGTAAVALIPFFLQMYQKLYIPVISEEQSLKARYRSFEMQYGLSGRECEVFRLIIEGNSNVEVADKLFISESTVKFHMSNILKKTACHNRTEITALFSKS